MAWYKKPTIIIIVLISALILGFLVLVWQQMQQPLKLKVASLEINQRIMSVEVASGPLELYRGLSDRSGLCLDCGMLFNFSGQEEREFVMRNMNFPLDIIFINKGRIISVAANLAPEGHSPSRLYSSGGPCDQVLEVNAGYAERAGWQIGNLVQVRY